MFEQLHHIGLLTKSEIFVIGTKHLHIVTWAVTARSLQRVMRINKSVDYADVTTKFFVPVQYAREMQMFSQVFVHIFEHVFARMFVHVLDQQPWSRIYF